MAKAKKQVYWRIVSRSVGRGPLHETFEDAAAERSEMLKEDPYDMIAVMPHEMTEKEFQDLPEFQGY